MNHVADKVRPWLDAMPRTSSRTSAGPTSAWHALSVAAVLDRLDTAESGLSSEDAARRLAETGPNELAASRRVSPWSLLLAQLKNVLILILLVAVGLSALLGHALEAVVIAVILLFAVVLGFVQEYRAERAIEGLRRMAAPVATALRDGEERDVAARELVPGDVVRLEAGARVPADARVMEAVNLEVDEAALTGESLPVRKASEPLAGADLAVGDRNNMVYAGTAVTYGRGSAVVVETGMRTEFGTIARLLEGVESRRTPLQENLDRVGHVLARAALAVVALIVLLGVLQGPVVLGHGDLRDRPGRGGRPGSPARGRDDIPRSRRAADGEAQRAGAAPVRRGNAGERLRHRFGQDRHADPRRDDRPADPRRRPERGRLRSGLRAARRVLRGRPPDRAAAAAARAAAGGGPRLGRQAQAARRGERRAGPPKAIRPSWR